jgi:hypothetical protein
LKKKRGKTSTEEAENGKKKNKITQERLPFGL